MAGDRDTKYRWVAITNKSFKYALGGPRCRADGAGSGVSAGEGRMMGLARNAGRPYERGRARARGQAPHQQAVGWLCVAAGVASFFIY